VAFGPCPGASLPPKRNLSGPPVLRESSIERTRTTPLVLIGSSFIVASQRHRQIDCYRHDHEARARTVSARFMRDAYFSRANHRTCRSNRVTTLEMSERPFQRARCLRARSAPFSADRRASCVFAHRPGEVAAFVRAFASRNLHYAPPHPRSGLWAMQRTQSRRTFSSQLMPFRPGDALGTPRQLRRIIRHEASDAPRYGWQPAALPDRFEVSETPDVMKQAAAIEQRIGEERMGRRRG